jgi:hypothetical protein
MSEAGSAALVTGLIMGFQRSQAVLVVVRTGVATILEQEGPTTVTVLAARTGTRPEALRRLVRDLAPSGLFTTDGETVGITEAGALLSEHHPRTLHGFTRTMVEQHYPAFAELEHSVRTGRPGAAEHYGAPWLEWVNANPERARVFARGMSDMTAVLKRGVFDGYRLPPGRVVADLGGSDGSVLVDLLTRDADPGRRGILVDRPATTPTAVPVLAAAGLSERVEIRDGDFFDAVPVADVYVLSSVLHDWSDAEDERILGTIAAAAAPGARLVVVEHVVPDDDRPHLAKDIDLTMLGMTTGTERTEPEFRELLDRAGFTLDRVVATPTAFSILEASLR